MAKFPTLQLTILAIACLLVLFHLSSTTPVTNLTHTSTRFRNKDQDGITFKPSTGSGNAGINMSAYREKYFNCDWPPPLYPQTALTSQKQLKVLHSVQLWAEQNQKNAIVYLHNGGLLGFYRDGALVSGDSDIDIRYSIKKNIASKIKTKLKAELKTFKKQLKLLSFNDMYQWGDVWGEPVAGKCYTEKKDVTDQLIDELNTYYLCKPTGNSPLQTKVNVRKEITYGYGPAWFIKMASKGVLFQEYMDYVNPKSNWNRNWLSMLKTIHSIDQNSDSIVSLVELNNYVQKVGIDLVQYDLQISLRERCRARKYLTWNMAYDKHPYSIQNVPFVAKQYGDHPLLDFPECNVFEDENGKEDSHQDDVMSISFENTCGNSKP